MTGFMQFHPLLDAFDRLNSREGQLSKFPYSDVYLDETDRKLVFKIALAGYDKNQIDITLKESVLTVKGVKNDSPAKENSRKYIEQGIAFREFKRAWTLGPQINTKSIDASFVDGILRIEFDLIIDEVKQITIK